MEEKDFRDHEYYEIVTEQGRRYMHILGCSWMNDGRDHPSLTDGEGSPLEAPYTSTEYTNVYILLDELLACKTWDERWDLITDYEGSCNQYEGDYTWEEFVEEGYDGPHGDHLPFDEITADTPDGDYEYYI